MENLNPSGMMKVLSPMKNPKTGKTYWVRCGAAYTNRDGSTNIYLDTYPTNGQLQVRELNEYDLKRRAERTGAGNDAAAADNMPF